MNKLEKELVKALSNSFITATKKLNTFLNQEVEITFDSSDVVEDFSTVSEMFEKVVTIRNSFKLGEFYTVLPVSCASPLAELMMSGKTAEEASSEVGELKEKAVEEIFSQISPDYSAELSRELYQNFNITVGKTAYAKDFNASKSMMPGVLQGAVVITYMVNFTRVAKDIIRQVIPIELFQQMLELIKPDLDTDEELVKMEEPNFDEDAIMVQPVQFPSFDSQTSMQLEGNKNFNLLLDIKLKLTVELGRAELPIKRVLELTRGSIIELDKIAGEPVELFANGKLVARGEVVVIEDNFGLRITNIISPDDRIKNL